MGEVNFTTRFYKGPDMNTAYRQAVSEAQPETSGGFRNDLNGTIFTTSGVGQAVHSPMTPNGADLWARERGGGAKYGPALAIPVAYTTEFELKKVNLTIQLPIRQWTSTRETTDIGLYVSLPDLLEREVDFPPPCDSGWRSTTWFDLHAFATQKAFAQFGEKVHDIDITPKLKTKKIVELAKGRSAIRYELVADYGGGRLYETKRQAVAAAKELLENYAPLSEHFKGSPLDVSIRAVRYWPELDSTRAATIRAVTVSAKADVTVTVAYAKTDPPPVSGWVFYGIAAT